MTSQRRYRIALLATVTAFATIAMLPSYITSNQRPFRMLKAWALESELLADAGVLFQTSASNCGHMALMMVLRLLHHEVPVALIDRAGAAKWGLSAAEIAHESAAAGLAARVHDIDSACIGPALARTALPAVALLGTHFVVIERLADAGATIVLDPSLGRLRMPLPVLQREWRRVLITFGDEPGEIRAAPCG